MYVLHQPDEDHGVWLYALVYNPKPEMQRRDSRDVVRACARGVGRRGRQPIKMRRREPPSTMRLGDGAARQLINNLVRDMVPVVID
jgi:hypothetical protein